jgi:hypothetical protein
MQFAQREGNIETGNIIGVFSQPQPQLDPPATWPVPDGTTPMETETDRIIREFKEIVKTFPEDEQEAVYPVMDQISHYISVNNEARAIAVVQKIGSLVTLSPAHENQLVAKIEELP